MPVLAKLAEAHDRSGRTLELLSLANRYRHLKNSARFQRCIAGQLTEELSDLPEADAEASRRKARETNAWQAARHLLAESSLKCRETKWYDAKGSKHAFARRSTPSSPPVTHARLLTW